MRDARIWLAGLLAAVAMPSAAQAQAPDYREGEVSDPAGDATIAYEDSGGTGSARLLDIRKVRANYDAGLGSLNLYFEGRDLENMTHSGITFEASITEPHPSTGRCDRTLRDGDFRISASGWRGYDQTETAYLINAAGATVGQGYIEWPGDNAAAHIGFVNVPSLLRRNYRCISDVVGIRGSSGYSNSSRDNVDDFCLGGCPSVPPPPPGVPAPANFRAIGNTLHWNAVPGYSSYKVATSLVPEGVPGRFTRYQTVTGTSFTPPAVPGATRYYGVAANVSNERWASPEVVITYPAPPTGGQGGGPNNPPVQPGPGPGPNQGVTPVPQGRGPVVDLTLTAAKARVAARKALVARYGRAFTRRLASGYKLSCRPYGAKATCAVKWRHKRFRYKGTVTVSRTEAGDRWRTAITRRVRG